MTGVELGSGTGAGWHYLRVHALRWLDDTAAFIQFIAETLVSIRGRVSACLPRRGETNPSLELSDYQPDHRAKSAPRLLFRFLIRAKP